MDIKEFIKDSVRYTRVMDLRVYGVLSVLSIIASLLLIIVGVSSNNNTTLIVIWSNVLNYSQSSQLEGLLRLT